MPSLIHPLAYLTPDLPGTGGVIKQRPEDFLVEEQPKGELTGQGEHLILYVEKTGMTTTDAARRIAKAFYIRRGEVGWAGMKDKHAVTRQQFSVRIAKGVDIDQGLAHIENHARLKVLWHERHDRKLRKGYHAGNRFVIYIRNVQATDVLKAKPVFDRLAQTGIPNYVGEQRFGFRQNSHLLGKLLLLDQHDDFLYALLGEPSDVDSNALKNGRAAYHEGEYDAALKHWPKPLRYDRQALDALRQHKSPEQAVKHIDVSQRNFLLSALQSYLFNQVLDARLRAGTLNQLLPGDLAWKHDSRAVFAVDQEVAQAENADDGRVPRLAVSPSGPHWGDEMTLPQDAVLAAEQQAVTDFGLTPEQLGSKGDMTMKGSRRPLREPLVDPDLSGGVDEHGPYLRLAFQLPRGTYATVALREITKSDLHTSLASSHD